MAADRAEAGDWVGAALRWFVVAARPLPWRATTDPYAILVSEVMLQQTPVVRVLGRYERWLERWPDPAALAAAPAADVLAEWIGLGYNQRALRLREACAVVAHDGWPDDLRTLPGVGPYTAAAVGALAFGRRELQIDVNVARVLDRVGREPPADPDPALGAALMEIGAVLCRARRAACEECPLASTGCRSAYAVAVPPRGREPAGERFEDSNRYVRGRIVAALAAGRALPDASDVEPERLVRAVDGLIADGLVERAGDGLRLPR